MILNILIIGPKKKHQKSLIKFLVDEGNKVDTYNEKLDILKIKKLKYKYLISFGYRFIVNKDVINYFRKNAINLHISFLPWNRGSDPNLWSILSNSPCGVTIHQLESGLDKGKILIQERVFFNDNETLKTTYLKLMDRIVTLFIKNWDDIKTGVISPYEQVGKGSYHNSKDKLKYSYLLKKGWDTQIKEIKGKSLDV